MAWKNARIFRMQTQTGDQKMKPITDFALQVGAKIVLKPNLVRKKDDRYFLLNESLPQFVRGDFFYAGTYLGKVRKSKFFPSFNLIAMLAKGRSNKIVLDNKTAWLFICGRDIFQSGIMSIVGFKSRGAHILVMNKYGECLGFGRILQNLDEKSSGPVVKNISDIGDFLRREM